jgi:hypothetical protein
MVLDGADIWLPLMPQDSATARQSATIPGRSGFRNCGLIGLEQHVKRSFAGPHVPSWLAGCRPGLRAPRFTGRTREVQIASRTMIAKLSRMSSNGSRIETAGSRRDQASDGKESGKRAGVEGDPPPLAGGNKV